MVLKTREKLIEVARQLFAHKGIENTTINDIATASDKGRRTIYTYFKNKREIYNAVIEQESERIVSKLREVLILDISPIEKLEQFLRLRFSMIDDTIVRQDSFRTLFSRDMKRVDRIRKLASIKELEILRTILDEGVNAGQFVECQCTRLVSLFQLILQGIDLSYLRDNATDSTTNDLESQSKAINFIIEGIKQ